MKEIPATIMRGGHITVPQEVLERLGVGDGDSIMFVIEDDSTVRLTASHYRSVASLAGAAGSLDQPLSWREMRRIGYGDRLSEWDSAKR